MSNHDTQKPVLDLVGECKSLILRDRVPLANFAFFFIVSVILVGCYWASKAEIDQVSRGEGRVIPSSSVQVVQNLEGGIVKEIKVTEGDRVEEGDLLIRIDDTLLISRLRENTVQLEALEARAARLTAEANGDAKIEFPDSEVSERPDLVELEQSLFEKKRMELEERRDTLNKSLSLAQREMSLTRPMVEQRVVSEVEQLRLERDINELEGELSQIGNAYRLEALEQRNVAQIEMARLREVIEADRDRVERTSIVAPVSGTVKKVHIKTVGGVIAPMGEIIDIVPADDDLVIEANIKPSDIAFVHVGQGAVVKFSAYDFSVYGGMDGEVAHVSADTIFDETRNEYFYQIKVRIGEEQIRRSDRMLIMPGMVAEVDIVTGKHTVLGYILKPFLRAQKRALRER